MLTLVGSKHAVCVRIRHVVAWVCGWYLYSVWVALFGGSVCVCVGISYLMCGHSVFVWVFDICCIWFALWPLFFGGGDVRVFPWIVLTISEHAHSKLINIRFIINKS